MKEAASRVALSRLMPCDSQGMNKIKINADNNRG